MPGGSAKKKLTKAEKEKLKKEEEEKAAKEEEEARAKAAEEERIRKEQEKKEAEERRRLEQEERNRRQTQLDDLNNILEKNNSVIENAHNERRKNSKWARYMLCDGSPDPTIPGEINTYMNLWREENTRVKIDDVLKDGQLPLMLIDELNFLLEDTPADQITPEEVAQYKETLVCLEDLLSEKLDRASHETLLSATELASKDTMNLESVVKDDIITLCIWGNLSKNPRIKSFEFQEIGFQFDLPKLLTLSDCAMRVLATKFDHLSHRCKTYLPRPKKKIIEEPPQEEVKEEQNEEEKTDEEKKEGEEEGEPEIERETTEDLMATLRAGNDDEEKKEEEKEEEPEEELPPEDEDKTPEPEEFEDFDGDEDVVDLRAYSPLGGVFQFNLLHMPPQPKNVNSWVMTELVDPVLKPMDYVADQATTAAPTPSAEDKDKEKEKKEEQKENKKDEKPPITVNMRLPGDVFFCEEPQVGRWNYDNNQWQLDGFKDTAYNEETRCLTFKTCYFGTMTLFQDTHINMPFQSWEIRPRGLDHALFTVIAAINELEIEIREDQCCLSKPDDKPELQHLIKKWMAPRDLIKKLQAAGINIFPSEDSSKYVSIQNKNPITEKNLYAQMALTTSAMAYSWSKWNAEVGNEQQIIVQGAECMKDEPLLEEDWSLFMSTKKRTIKLKMTEFDENFSEDYAEGTNFHADLYHQVLEVTSDAASERIKKTSYRFTDAVTQLLMATKVLTYA